MQRPVLQLKKNEERRLRAGHAWVYSNEVDVARTPLKGLEPGVSVDLVRFDGKPIGSAYANPHSLICARLFSRRPGVELDSVLIAERLRAALRLREMLFPQPYYRLVHAESDRLPGLIVDRFGDVLAVQLNTAGMERARDAVLEALTAVMKPSAVLLRNDTSARTMEGLEKYTEVAFGEVPEMVALEENGVAFEAPLLTGQKTGWFFDHRLNRARMQAYVPGKRVLDVFSYVGGWAVQAAAAGAAEVMAVDSSAQALQCLAANAERLGYQDRVSTRTADAFDALNAMVAEGQRFDVVVVDPPALVKRKKDLEEGAKAYFQLNRLAMQVLKPEGILISASCSYHFNAEMLARTLLRASRSVGRPMQILEQGHQGPDHPIQPAITETEYLKAYFCRVY